MTKSPYARRLDDYAGRYPHIALSRTDAGVLEVRMHSDGGSLLWGAAIHDELGHCLAEIAQDAENKAVILTGTGDDFCVASDPAGFGGMTPRTMVRLHEEGVRLLRNLLAIEVPVIGVVNGPAHIHAELALVSNIVVASDRASFRDAVHFIQGAVPGDGVHAIWPALIGPTRASYFLLTGETIGIEDAKALGLVNEIVPHGTALDRAHALAAEIARQPDATRRYTRTLLSAPLRRRLDEELSHGLALESLGILAMMDR